MTRQKNGLFLGAAAAVILSLSACTSVKRELGVDRNSPDEFMVVKNTPLTLPPDYTLRPPLNPDAAAAATVDDAASAARAALIGEVKTTAPAAQKSASEAALLGKLGATAADPEIRQKIDADNGYISLKNRSVADQIIFWSDETAPIPEDAPASVVNPAAEAERLKKNKAAGKPLNEGDVPVIEKKTGTLDKIF
ncbi:MAG: DUF3035 domain-containing protein [Alphaproteobacteria bacterium]|nr:DUF3035 domain-containing protein [Alphaproteobacteria bacterium]